MIDFLADPISYLAEFISDILGSFGFSAGLIQVVLFIIGAGILTAGPMLFTLFLIWAERKILGRIQDRLGPNRVGKWGIFQTVADMIKIFTKEHIDPQGVDWLPYNVAPIMAIAAVLMLWATIPLTSTVYGVNINIGALYIIATGAIGTLGIILAGWGSNNKYALLGAFRGVAQLISYEVPMVICLIIPVMLSGSMGMNDIASAQTIWYIFMAPLAGLIFLIATIAEIGRAPFDLLEAESEIVAGFNIEYSGLKFGMFYVADFLHAFTIALIFSTLFLGGWRGPFAEQYPLIGFVYLLIKTVVVWFVTVLIRGSLPRMRIDQLLDLNWKYLTPMALSLVIFTSIVDKLLPARELAYIKVAVLLVINAILFIAMDKIVKINAIKPKRVVPHDNHRVDGVVEVPVLRGKSGKV